jgi:L-2-hydroxyglutarate oxidase
VKAIHVQAGIVNDAVNRKLVELIGGGEVRCSARVLAINENSDQIAVESTAGAFTADYAVTCAGLHSDRVAKLTGIEPEAKIVPFRGEYYELKHEAQYLCRNLIYPVRSELPSGVHFRG